ncbi:PREDICTED: uncharacterized protein LOC109588721 [Amphimedon queenslandica]|uniref:Fibronectin type-III domain-containing protein n=1 Tax=Amphimedon queenslandica TaxID=400682 RepID=A0AAN0JU41_AMPQE|nr:PREDICTED: uncharacterized protein LOC109588721 [Amphimedon queenslandica]|eukprot:XP_019860397.1 PREDICTED: uncharacterized protein LOC109588721 [Amphimedon queenslandica]
MLLNTVALLLGVELILLYSGLGDGAFTNFQCTDGPVCAGDKIECSCTTDTGALDWFISYSPVDTSMWSPILSVSFNKATTNEEYYYGYNFKFNTTYTGLNTSILTFNLNHSESVRIECANGDYGDKMNTKVTDLGYYAKAPTNLTTTFNPSGVTLQWEDTGNNCTSTEYQVTVISCLCTSTSVLMYNTSKTALHLSSRDLLENVTYTYTVRGWNEQESNNSKPFTLAPVEVMSVTINITNTTDPCKNNICCINVTLNIILESLDICFKHPNQYYSISYNPSTGHIPASFKINETEFGKLRLNFNETHCLVTPTKPISMLYV